MVTRGPQTPPTFGPKSWKVIDPPAGEPTDPPMTGLPGWLAVPLSVAVSLIGLLSRTVAEAWVTSVGVTGPTVKHSFESPTPLCVELGTPLVDDVKSARQQ